VSHSVTFADASAAIGVCVIYVMNSSTAVDLGMTHRHHAYIQENGVNVTDTSSIVRSGGRGGCWQAELMPDSAAWPSVGSKRSGSNALTLHVCLRVCPMPPCCLLSTAHHQAV
jgi:hypothetical protein